MSELDALDIISLDDEEVDPPYTPEFITFIDDAVTGYHAVDIVRKELLGHGYKELREQEDWVPLLKHGGGYFVTRNNSSIIAFAIGGNFHPGNDSAFAMIGSHIDAICFKLKPHSTSSAFQSGNIERIGVAPYSGGGRAQSWDASFSTWWNRDLGLGGRVVVRDGDGSVKQQLIRTSGPVAIIPSSGKEDDKGPFNYENNMVPIVGLIPPNSQNSAAILPHKTWLSEHHSKRLLLRIAQELGSAFEVNDILDFDLELYDTHKATLLGLESPPSLLSAPRMDDKLCSFAAYKSLITTATPSFLENSADITLIGLFDNEEIGSGLRQGAKSNLLETVSVRVVETFAIQDAESGPSLIVPTSIKNLWARTMARSFLLSADVANGVNPDFIGSEIYADGLAPALNKGVVVSTDPNGYMATDPWGLTLARMIARRANGEIQLFQNRSDTGGGGTIGPMLSQRLGCPAMDVGFPMLSMHSIRGITGSKDVNIGIGFFEAFLSGWQSLRTQLP